MIHSRYLTRKGIGELIRIAVKKGRSVNKNLKIGICGEHGGEPKTVEFCHREGLSYVPLAVPCSDRPPRGSTGSGERENWKEKEIKY